MTRQRTIRAGALAAVVLAVLAASAPPVASTDAAELVQATDDYVVGSKHDTATDLQNAQTLTNLVVDGSGGAADLRLDSGYTYSVVEDSGDGAAEGSRTLAGDNNDGEPFTVEMQTESTRSGTVSNLSVDVVDTFGESYGMTVDIYAVQEAPDGSTGEGTLLKDNWEPAFSTGTQTIQLDSSLDVETGETWTIEFVTTNTDAETSGDNDDQLRIGTDDDSGLTDWYWNPESGFVDSGGALTFGFSQPTSATYLSQQHSVTGGEQAMINITSLSDASITATVQTDSGTVLNQSTLSSTGSHRLSLASYSGDTVEVKFEVDVTGSNPVLELADESILFTNHAPEASNLSPQSNAQLSESSTEFSADISDKEFPTAQGDSVTAELFVDNQSVGSKTVTSNQTVTITKELTEGGEHTYHWKLSDSYGEVTSTSTRTLSVPSEVTVRSVVGNHSIIDNQSMNISARLYSGELIFQRNVSNGRIDLSNVSVDREYILSVRADGYYQRTIIISSIYEQSTIYLLPTDTEAVLDVFRLNDRTGKYPTESSKLVIKRALNTTDGGLEWVRVAGDYFGAAGQFKVQLQQDRRYRLVISNSQGDTRVLGHYSTDIAETVVLNPVPVGVSLDVNASTYNWDAVRQNDTISFSYHDPKNETTQLHVSIYEQGNASNVVLNQTYLNDPYGTLSVTQPLTGTQTNASWVVEWSAERNGETISGKVMTSSPREPLVPELADWIKHSLSITAVIIIGGLFTQLNAAVGGVTTAIVGGGFWFAGWLPNAAGGAIAIALLLSVLVKGAQARGL
ncbi:hypothetical protein [Halobacterium sp. CBA1126]|uniref:hypothetical protein n=1 Tax=Halobacterium sp. CBA1126 TaxID=2668074 RepID=UPI0012FAFB00|nr:hypothetical protein [Halobacterium sp. CBA1126]MUV59789.1 hypothetical protein [Halobacterium sp. CBA1126]